MLSRAKHLYHDIRDPSPTAQGDMQEDSMPIVWIPAPLRDLTQGKTSVVAIGSTVREAVENLEVQFPGIKERLCENDKIRPNISVFVDGQITHLKIREKLEETSEVHFVIAISGG